MKKQDKLSITNQTISSYSKLLDDYYYKEMTSALFDDTFRTATTSASTVVHEKIWLEEKRRLQNKIDHLNDELDRSEGLLEDLTTGNEVMQQALIDQDPMNIRYIKNPYVSIQLAAIAANPNSFEHIRNPSQEAVDTYRIVK